MSEHFEARRDTLLISTNPRRLDLDAICGFLSRAYWAEGRRREVIEKSLQNSLVFGIYDGDRQIGLARVVTDYATFAWLCDVFVDAQYRRRGVGKWLIATILCHPQLHGLRRFLLATRDAHGLYSQFGFEPLAVPGPWMARLSS